MPDTNVTASTTRSAIEVWRSARLLVLTCAVLIANLRKYINSTTAITDYREFPNRTHHTVGQEGWEEVADFALRWASQHAIDQVTYDDV